jgi:hypothetical protein
MRRVEPRSRRYELAGLRIIGDECRVHGIIVLLALESNQGTTSRSNPRAPEAAAEAAVYEAVYGYPNRPAVHFDVSAVINAGYGPRKRSPAASRRR